VNGYLDFYYQSNFNQTNTTPSRVFGKNNGVLQLNTAEATLKRKQGDVAFRIDIGAGETVDALSPSVTTAGTGAITGLDASRHVMQALLTYTPSQAPGLSVTAGKMYTHMGFEITRAKDDWNYTRGYLFNFGIPLWHEGLNVAYTFLPDHLTAGVYAYNAWDGRMIAEANRSLTLGANLTATLVPGTSLIYNYIGGPETADSRSLREVHELILQYGFADRVWLAADAIMGSQQQAIGGDRANWNAWAVYGKATVAGPLAFVARYEIFDDSDKGFAVAGALGGATTAANTWVRTRYSSITGGFNWDMGDGLESRIEYRYDTSADAAPIFAKPDATSNDNESTLNLALLYSF
jgi:hypothetical protein